MGFDTSGFIDNALTKAQDILGTPAGAAVAGAGVGALATGTVIGIGSAIKKKSSRSSKKKAKSRGKKRSSRRKTKGRRTPRTAGKGKDRSTKRIRYTSKGQPYVITRSGKAKFIKKTSAKRSHKQKGGRY